MSGSAFLTPGVLIADTVSAPGSTGADDAVGERVGCALAGEGIARTETYSADVGTPAKDLPAQWDQLVGKFRGRAAPVIGTTNATSVIELAHCFEDASGDDAPRRACA